MPILIAIISLVILIALHELGHFVFAKLFGVRVEEFGIGYPPKLFSVKKGETVYSLNLIPFGAFVRLSESLETKEHPRNFLSKPLWQRGLIIMGGILAFWLIAWVIFSALAGVSGIVSSIPDDLERGVSNIQVRVIGVQKDSPAFSAGIKEGDTIRAIALAQDKEPTMIDKVGEVQDISKEFRGKEIAFLLQRGSEEVRAELTPRLNPPSGEGSVGILLTRTGLFRYAWYEAPWQGLNMTARLTQGIAAGLYDVFSSLFQKQGLPSGVTFQGPVGITQTLQNTFQRSASEFFSMIAMISIYLAIFNALPIPVTDGGKMLLLMIEGVRKKPIAPALEQRVAGVVFAVLILLMVWVTIRDIAALF